MTAARMLEQVVSGRPGAFALLHRPDSSGPDRMDILFGRCGTADRLADIPCRDERPGGGARHDALVLIPHQQITERGFSAVVDDSPLLVMSVTDQADIDTSEALGVLPDERIALDGGGFDVDDDTYMDTVRTVLENEIATGEGANFVIKRSFVTTISGYSTRSALTLFRRLLTREAGAYWTFLVHTGDRTFVGATPERHVTLRDGTATMNPISGTYRYPPAGPDLDEVLEFLADRKETDELYMVLDEELKMMARVCRDGGRVVGPFLRQMTRLAHTEYLIEGRSDLDPRDILRETMFAPTVTGSPLQNACRVIARHEPRGRGYYGGVVALVGRDVHGGSTLDSAILIRTADIRASDGDDRGRVEVGVGATLVRHSDPATEVAETCTKAAGVLSALGVAPALDGDPRVADALRRRNTTIARFWLDDTDSRVSHDPALSGLRVLVVDGEDAFSAMLAHQLRAVGLDVRTVASDERHRFEDHDLVVLGPGPGDPRDVEDPRMVRLAAAVETLLARRIPFLAVCLSHQLLCRYLGLEVTRRAVPNQGTQREIDLFGSPERVGFYNSYAARGRTEWLTRPVAGEVQVSLDPVSGEVHALRGPRFSSVQFHPESVLTRDGTRILAALLTRLTASEEVLSA